MNRYDINIDPVYNTKRYSVQIDDHLLKKSIILDNTYQSTKIAFSHAQRYIGARRQLGGNRSSKPFPSVSKAECVGSIPTAPAKLEEKTYE